jgi:hypothetical protein
MARNPWKTGVGIGLIAAGALIDVGALESNQPCPTPFDPRFPSGPPNWQAQPCGQSALPGLLLGTAIATGGLFLVK